MRSSQNGSNIPTGRMCTCVRVTAHINVCIYIMYNHWFPQPRVRKEAELSEKSFQCLSPRLTETMPARSLKSNSMGGDEGLRRVINEK